MGDYETIRRLDLLIEQQVQIGNEIIRCLRAIEANQKERASEPETETETEENIEEEEPKARPAKKFKYQEPGMPAQKPKIQVQDLVQDFDEMEDVQQISAEEMQELERTQKRVL